MSIDKQIILANRLQNNSLIDKSGSIEEVLDRLLGIQAQYYRHGFINIINRLELNENKTIEKDMDTAILAWGQRQTLHYYNFDTWQNIVLLLINEQRWPKKYFETNGLNLEKSISILMKALKLNNGLTRKEIENNFDDDWKILSNWSAIFLEASRSGHLYIKRDNLIGDKSYYFWNDNINLPIINKKIKLSILRKYLNAYGPATKKDAAHFFGVTQDFFDFDLSNYFSTINYSSKELFYVELGFHIDIPEVVLLGKFDPLLIAYKDKELLYSKIEISKIWKKGGQISAVILIDGKFTGVWKYQINNDKFDIYVFLENRISKRQKQKLEFKFYSYAVAMNKRLNVISYDIV